MMDKLVSTGVHSPYHPHIRWLLRGYYRICCGKRNIGRGSTAGVVNTTQVDRPMAWET